MNSKKKYKKAQKNLDETISLFNSIDWKQCDEDLLNNDEIKHLWKKLSDFSDNLKNLSQEQSILRQQKKLFSNLTSAVLKSPTLDQLFKTSLESSGQLLKAERIIIYKLDENKHTAQVVAESVIEEFPSLLDTQICAAHFQELVLTIDQKKKISLIIDINKEINLTNEYIEILKTQKVRSLLMVPIYSHNQKLYGLLIVHHCSDIRNWQDYECQFMNDLKQQLEYHLNYIHLIAEQEYLARQKQLFSAISTRTREIPEENILFQGALEGAKEILNADRVLIYQFNLDWTGQIVAEVVTQGFRKAIHDEINDPCFKQIYTQEYQSGKVKAVNNVYEDDNVTDCYLDLLERYQVKSNLVVSIWLKEKLYGLLIVHQCTKFRHWQQGEFHFMSELSQQLAISLESIHFIKEQKYLARQKQLFSALSARTREVPEENILFQGAVEGAKEILNADRAVIYQFNPDWTGQIVAEAVTEGFREAIDDEINDPCFKRMYTEEYQSGKVKAVNNVYEDNRVTDCYLDLLERYQIKANLVVPIRIKEKLYGLLIVHQCTQFRYWQEAEFNFMSELSLEIGYSLDYIHFLHQQEFVGKKAWLFGDIAFRARQSLNIKDIFKTAVQGIRQILDTDRVVVYQFNPDWSGTMVAESVLSAYTSVLEETIDDPCFRGNYVELYRNGRVKAINNIRTEHGLTECHIRTLEKYQVKANLVAPIRQNGELMGLIIVHHCRSPRIWQTEDLDFLSQLATQIEYALDHLVYIEKIENNARRSRLFGDIAFRARQSLSEQSVLASVVQGARKELDTDRVVVYRFNPDWSGTMINESVGDGWSKVIDEQIDDPCFRGRYIDLYQNGRVSAINDIYNQPGLSDCHIRTLEQYDVKANLVAPLRKNGTLFGLLIAHHCRSSRIWHKIDMNFFSELATQAEYALDHISYIEKLEQAKAMAEKASQEQKQQKEAIEHQLEQLMTEIEDSFEGNLTVRATNSHGDIGQVVDFVNLTLENLQEVVQQVKSSSEAVIDTVNVNQGYIEATYRETLHQADSVTVALDSIQQMNNSIQKVANNAKEAKSQVQQATSSVKEGDRIINKTVEGILSIRETVEETASKLKSLGEASQKISRVVNLIKDLAGQTHVLALNASIKTTDIQIDNNSFTIVAEEIRSLSEKSTYATQEIEQILEQIQLEVNLVTTAMEKGREQVIKGVELVENSRERLNETTNITESITNLVEDMAQAAISHAQTSSFVSQTMTEVENIAQNTSKQSVQGAESFNKLLELAKNLQESVAQFKVD